ncbi:MAG: NAD(P)/FAD-dependent oxidoreductase, partial [Coraliomargarita sp.]|nr:NAD(P)/FAD-dependent oxidoreductase [Coraliomargarita sp.]
RTSAWEARTLNELNYHFDIAINWLGSVSENQLRERFAHLRKQEGKKAVKNTPIDPIPRRLWERLTQAAGITEEAKWAQLSKQAESSLVSECVNGSYSVQGKTTNKDEFVTAGGVRLKEINFKTMESRIIPGLHFTGECLDIDGITGGFNFQAAWTGGRIAGEALSN